MPTITNEALIYLFTRLLLMEQEDAMVAARNQLNQINARRKQGTLTVEDRKNEEELPALIKKLENNYAFLLRKEKTDRAYTTPAEYALALNADIAKRREAALHITPSGASRQRLINLERLSATISGDVVAWKD